jgi:hypothetical protein
MPHEDPLIELMQRDELARINEQIERERLRLREQANNPRPAGAPPPLWAQQILYENAPPRVNLFGGGGKKKAPKVGPKMPALTDEVMNKLLTSVREIYETPAYVSGPPLVEKVLGAKDALCPVAVVMVHRDMSQAWEGMNQFTQQLEELGWGVPNKAMNRRQDGNWATYKFTVFDRLVSLYLEVEDKPFDKFKTNINMVKYSLEDGLVIDPRAQKDIDKGWITCNDKPDEARLKWLTETVCPRYEELTGRKFKVKKG